MSTPSRPLTRLCLAILGTASVAVSTRAADAGLGTVTVRFKNATKNDVVVDVRFSDGVSWPFPTRWDGSLCKESGPCEGVSIMPPPPRVQIVPAGGIVESSWDGAYFDIRSCEGGQNYRCATAKRAPSGPYKVRLEGARAYRQAGPRLGAPAGGYVTDAEPDTSKGACNAEAAFTLDGSAKTVDAQIVCAPAAK
jgi:hypothetical protein